MKIIAYGCKVGPNQGFHRGKPKVTGERIEETIEKDGKVVCKVTIAAFSPSGLMLFKNTKYPSPSDREVEFNTNNVVYRVFLDDYLDIHDDDYVEGEIIDGETTAIAVDRSDIVPRKKVLYTLSFKPIDESSSICSKFVDKYKFIKQNNGDMYVLISSDTNLISAAERDAINLNISSRIFRDVYVSYPGKCPSCSIIDDESSYGDICGCGYTMLPCPLCEDNDIVIPALCNDCRFKYGA